MPRARVYQGGHAPGQEFTTGGMPRGKGLPGGACPGARVYQGGHAPGQGFTRGGMPRGKGLPGGACHGARDFTRGALPRGKDFNQGGHCPPPWRPPWIETNLLTLYEVGKQVC